MDRICRLQNTIQEYAWGSQTLIPNLMGEVSPAEKPQAELWMGAHPKAPSLVNYEGEWHPLDQLISIYPVEILGADVADRYANKLPYLFKILAASKPLSIQAHPNLEQAVEGFERENRLGVPLNAGQRNYRDDNHKPECICALSPYWALCGFRPIPEIQSFFSKIQVPEIESSVKELSTGRDSNRLKLFFQKLITLSPAEQQSALRKIVKQAAPYASQHPVFEWILKLHEAYGYDFGILSPLFLNLVCLQPGQALFLSSGELHAYLSGLGIELMANSDNVLRGGLTPKHVDVPELLTVLRFEEKKLEVLNPVATGACEASYKTRAEEFFLSVISPQQGKPYQSEMKRSVEIMICVDGNTRIVDQAGKNQVSLSKGQSVIVPSKALPYRIEGEGVLYKAGIPGGAEISSRS